MTEKDKGTHLGYAEYHTTVASDLHSDLVDDLAEIREKHSGEERYKNEQQRLLEFHNNISERIDKINKQIDGIMQHESENAVSRANKICESAYQTHQEDDLESIPQNTGFKTAKERSE